MLTQFDSTEIQEPLHTHNRATRMIDRFLFKYGLHDAPSLKHIIAPVHDGPHWYLVLIDIENRRNTFHDSIASNPWRRIHVQATLEAFLQFRYNTSFQTELCAHALQQENGSNDCGIYTILHARSLAHNTCSLGYCMPYTSTDIRTHMRQVLQVEYCTNNLLFIPPSPIPTITTDLAMPVLS